MDIRRLLMAADVSRIAAKRGFSPFAAFALYRAVLACDPLGLFV